MKRSSQHTLLKGITDESGRYELVGYVAPPEGVDLRLTMRRRETEQFSVTGIRHFGINESEWYTKFPVEPGGNLTEMDFIYETTEPGKVRQRVVRQDLAEKREERR